MEKLKDSKRIFHSLKAMIDATKLSAKKCEESGQKIACLPTHAFIAERKYLI